MTFSIKKLIATFTVSSDKTNPIHEGPHLTIQRLRGSKMLQQTSWHGQNNIHISSHFWEATPLTISCVKVYILIPIEIPLDSLELLISVVAGL